MIDFLQFLVPLFLVVVGLVLGQIVTRSIRARRAAAESGKPKGDKEG